MQLESEQCDGTLNQLTSPPCHRLIKLVLLIDTGAALASVSLTFADSIASPGLVKTLIEM